MSDIQEWKPSINPWIMIIPVILAAFICILDTTIGNVALPHMAGAFSASRDESMWILTSYLVAAGIVMPAVDWLSKIFGRKNYFVLSILLFTISTLLGYIDAFRIFGILAFFVIPLLLMIRVKKKA